MMTNDPRIVTDKTLVSETYQLKYGGLGYVPDPNLFINPYITVASHKDRSVISETAQEDAKRGNLEDLLKQKAKNPYTDKDPSFMNNLGSFEQNFKTQVSGAAPGKAHRQFSALRAGRDPRTQTQMKGAQRPHSAYGGMAYMRQQHPKRPFLTFERAPMSGKEWREFCKSSFLSKIRNERIMINNTPYVHNESQAIKSVVSSKENKVQRSNQSQENSNIAEKKSTMSAPIVKEEPQIQTSSQDQKAVSKSVIQKEVNDARPANPETAAEVMHVIQRGNCEDIVQQLTTHEQLQILQNVLNNDQFKEAKKAAKKTTEIVEHSEQKNEKLQIQSEKKSEKAQAVSKELTFGRQAPKSVDQESASSKARLMTDQWQVAEPYFPPGYAEVLKATGKFGYLEGSDRSSNLRESQEQDDVEREERKNQRLVKKVLEIAERNNLKLDQASNVKQNQD